jgi:hypothetical protein
MKKAIIIIISLAAFVLTYYAIQQIFFKEYSFNDVMIEAANQLNESCPLMVDEETQLDNAVVLPDNIFQYNYTMVNSEKQEINTTELRNYLEPLLTNNVKTNPDLKIYRDNKVTMNYYYKDKFGEAVMKISVSPDKYKY